MEDIDDKVKMREACKSDESISQVKQLLDDGFPIDQPIIIMNQWTALHRACHHGSEKIVSLLLSRGAWIDKKHKRGDTPLHVACAMEHESIALILIKNGASVNAMGSFDFTPLHLACEISASIVRLLLEHGGDLNMKDQYGRTPLHFACYYGREEGVVEILKHLSKTSSRDHFQSQLKLVREWWEHEEKELGKKHLETVLSDELMSSLEHNLSTNRENNEKGAR